MCTSPMKKHLQPPSAPAASVQGIVRTDLDSFQEWMETHGKTLPTSSTLLELVHSVNSYTANDVETVALVTYLINSGRVRLRGTFAGAKILFSQTRARRNQNGEPAHPSKDDQHE